MGNRLVWVDNLKAFAIILVIAGHCHRIDFVPLLSQAIYSFHIPLFFIISGFFVKKKYANVCVGGGKLLRYYLVTSLIIAIVMLLKGSSLKSELLRIIWANASESGVGLFHEMPPIRALWFLPALIIGRVLYSILPENEYSETNNALSLLKNRSLYIVLMFTIVAFWGAKQIRMPLCLHAGLISVLYLYVGHGVKSFSFLKNIPLRPFIIIGLPLLVIMSFGVTWVSVCSYYLGLLGLLFGIIISIMFIRLFEEFGNKSNTLLMFIGENTLMILCVHCLFDFFVIPGIPKLPHDGIFFPIELLIRLTYDVIISYFMVLFVNWFDFKILKKYD